MNVLKIKTTHLSGLSLSLIRKKSVITLPQLWKIFYFLSENQLIMDSG